MRVKSVTPAGIHPVYNMTVDEHHNYMIVGGVILKNCDAARYFCATRVLQAEREAVVEDDYIFDRDATDYDDEMTGGDFDDSYMTYGG